MNRNTPWTKDECNAVALLYKAHWRWPAIAAHVSGIYGNERTPQACQTRAGILGILDPARKGHQFAHNYDADIAELMDQDHTLSEMVEAIKKKYGVTVSATYVRSRATKMGDTHTTWVSRKGKRISDRVGRSNARTPKARRQPNSRASRLRALGIPERRYYAIRETLIDEEIEHTEQDIIDLCLMGKRL